MRGKSEVTPPVPTTGTADVGELTTCSLTGERAHIYAARASFQGERKRKYGELLAFYFFMLKLNKNLLADCPAQ